MKNKYRIVTDVAVQNTDVQYNTIQYNVSSFNIQIDYLGWDLGRNWVSFWGVSYLLFLYTSFDYNRSSVTKWLMIYVTCT